MPVGVIQRAGHLLGDPYRLLNPKLLLTGQTGIERLTFYIGHHIVEKAVGHSRVVEAQDVGVLQVGGYPDLVEEPLAAQHSRKLWLEHLDRDLAVVLEVLGQVDRRHAALAELALDPVVVGQGP